MGGVIIVSLQHGPVPPGRRMFDVSAEETERLADAESLQLVLKLEHQDGQFGRAEVSWTRLAFSKVGARREGNVGSPLVEERRRRINVRWTRSICRRR
jgi:hypothetical protein